MSGSSDSDQHRAIKRNGDIQRHERELRSLREEFAAYRSHDVLTHEALTGMVQGVASTLGKYTFAGRIVWVLLLAAFGVTGSFIGWQVSELRSLRDSIEAVDDKTTEHIHEGMEIGRGLRRDVDRLQRHIDLLENKRGPRPD